MSELVCNYNLILRKSRQFDSLDMILEFMTQDNQVLCLRSHHANQVF